MQTAEQTRPQCWIKFCCDKMEKKWIININPIICVCVSQNGNGMSDSWAFWSVSLGCAQSVTMKASLRLHMLWKSQHSLPNLVYSLQVPCFPDKAEFEIQAQFILVIISMHSSNFDTALCRYTVGANVKLSNVRAYCPDLEFFCITWMYTYRVDNIPAWEWDVKTLSDWLFMNNTHDII